MTKTTKEEVVHALLTTREEDEGNQSEESDF